jgi:hypothetical protein
MPCWCPRLDLVAPEVDLDEVGEQEAVHDG